MPSYNGRFGNDGPTDQILEKAAIAKGEHNRHMERLRLTGIEYGKQVIPLADGTVVISQKLGTLESVHVEAVPVEKNKRYSPIDYYAGLMWGGNLAAGKLIEESDRASSNWFDSFIPSKSYSFAPTAVTAGQFKLDDTKGQGKYLYEFGGTAYAHTTTTKLMCKVEDVLNASVAPFKATQPKPIYQTFMPSMYTGTMRKLVQFVLGIGKQFNPSYWVRHGFEFKPDKPLPTGQVKFYEDLRTYYLATDSIYDFTYDFRFDMCHNVCLETNGDTKRWWLLLVDRSRGVYVMPLELDPVSTTAAFKEWLKSKLDDGDTQAWAAVALEVIDFWGGFPTGKGFDKYVDRWVEAGVIGHITSESFTKYVSPATTWTNAVSWAFEYQKPGGSAAAKASVVAYEDHDLPSIPGDPNSYITRRMREMDMTIDFESNLVDYPVNASGYGGAALTLVGELQHIGTDTDEPWLDAKIQRLTESDAETLIRAAYPKFEALDKDWGPLDKMKAVTCLRGLKGVPIISKGSVNVTTVFMACYSPSANYTKFPDTNMDMCTSIWLPANTRLKGSGEYKSPTSGMSVPVYVWHDENNTKHHVYEWTGGLKDKQYTDWTMPSSPVQVPYEKHYGCAYVDTLEDGEENDFPDFYVGGWTQYRYDSPSWWSYWVKYTSASNDVTPEGLFRADYALVQTRNFSTWGGPNQDKARHVLRSVYIPLGDAEAALAFRYVWVAGETAWTQDTSVITLNNAVSYDWGFDILSAEFADFSYFAIWRGAYDPPRSYSHFPDSTERAYKMSTSVGGEPAVRIGGLVELNAGWVRGPTGGVFCDHWMKIDAKCYSTHYGGNMFTDLLPEREYPTVDTPSESKTGRGAKCEYLWTYHYGNNTAELMRLDEGNTVDSSGRTYEYVSKDRAFLDILELQPSLFDPPTDSPYVEHDYTAVFNCWGTPSGQAMKAPNWYPCAVLGTMLDPLQTGAMCCFVGPAVK